MTTVVKISWVLFILVLSHCTYAQKNQEKLVKESFEKYRSAILNDRGEEAVNYVDSRTISYYADILDLVKTGDSSIVEVRSVLDKLMVFMIRHRVSKEDILSFDGRSLLIYAIESGMVGKNSVANSSLGEVTIEGDFAKGQFVANGEKAPVFFHFYKEEGQWKIDLTSLFPMSVIALDQIVQDSGENENDFLFSLLKKVTGNTPGDEIWQPID